MKRWRTRAGPSRSQPWYQPSVKNIRAHSGSSTLGFPGHLIPQGRGTSPSSVGAAPTARGVCSPTPPHLTCKDQGTCTRLSSPEYHAGQPPPAKFGGCRYLSLRWLSIHHRNGSCQPGGNS